MSLLSLCQDAAVQLSLPRPTAIVGSSDLTALLLLRLAQEEGEALAARYPWEILQTEVTFTTLAAETQTGVVPADFDRVIPDTIWNRTTRRRVVGPLSADEWAESKAKLRVYVNPTFRIRGGSFLMTPTPPAGETVAFEYVSKNFCRSSGGTAQAAWALDTDVGRLSESLMKLGLVWRFRAAKGLPYGEDLALYEKRVLEAMMRDGGGKMRISASPTMADRVPTSPQVPETLVF
jgi:hypothetical protein